MNKNKLYITLASRSSDLYLLATILTKENQTFVDLNFFNSQNKFKFWNSYHVGLLLCADSHKLAKVKYTFLRTCGCVCVSRSKKYLISKLLQRHNPSPPPPFISIFPEILSNCFVPHSLPQLPPTSNEFCMFLFQCS